MRRSTLRLLFFILMLCGFSVFAHAQDGLTVADRLAHWNAARYDISAPAWCHGDPTWTVQASYTPDPENANAMLLDLLILDQDGHKAYTGDQPPIIFLPYPQGHDAAMGYDYKIERVTTGNIMDRAAPIDPAIAFRPDPTNPSGIYRISWSKMTPKAAEWELIMTKMNWNGDFCSYTVGAQNKKVTVTRRGRDVTISGGEIANDVQLVHILDGIDNYQDMFGWHTESGSYTFHNVTLHYLTVMAHEGENYKITLDASVKGNYSMYCDLRNGANLELINNDIIHSDFDYSMLIFADTSCGMTVTGNGKILIGNGDDWVSGTSNDKVPIRISLNAVNAVTNEAAIKEIKEFEGRVSVSYDQVKIANGYPPIRSYCTYRDPQVGDEICTDPETGDFYALDTEFVVKKLRPAKGVMTEPVLESHSELDEGAMFRPLLVAGEEGANYLRSEITEEVSGRSVRYEIHIVDADDNALSLSQKSSLYIPYPEGMNMLTAAEREVTVRHVTDAGEELFSTKDGSVTLTPYGFRISVSSLSPFEVSWTSATADIPQTGDSMPLALCVILLTASLSAVALLKRSSQKE